MSEHDSTRIIGQRELTIDGVPVQWWAVGTRPTLVTVRARFFGSLSEFTAEDPVHCALTLATRLLNEHYERAAAARQRDRSSSGGSRSVLNKPGWFDEADDVDLGSA